MHVTGLRVVPQSALRRMGALMVAFAAVFGAVLLLQEPAHAGDSYTWTGEGGNSSWTNSCNWWPKDACQEKYPGKENPDDTATIEGLDSGPSAVTLGEPITLASLNLGKGPTGSSLDGGKITVNQSFNWTGGFLKTEVTLAANSVGTISGFDYKELKSTLHNNSRLVLDSGTLHMANATVIDNVGTFSIAKGSKVDGLVCCVTPAKIKSPGTVEIGSSFLPGDDKATIDSVALETDNIVDVGGGVLELRWAPSKIAAGTSFMGDGKFRITNAADLKMAGRLSVAEATEFELASCAGTCNPASLSGKGNMTGSGQFLWTGGDVDGELTLGQQIDTYIDGPAQKDLDGKITNIGRTVALPEPSTAPPPGQIRFGAGSVFSNPGIFIARERVEMVGIGGCCSAPVVANFFNTDTGTFSAAGASGTPQPNVTTIKSMAFRAGGTVHVESGVFDLSDGAATIPADSKFTGGGSVKLTEGQTATMAGPFSLAPKLELEIGSCKGDDCTAGRLQGVGTLGGGGSLRWVSGYFGTGFTGANDSLTIAAGSKMALTGPSLKQLLGKITNRGTATFTSPAAPAPATGPLVFGTNGHFVNAATFNVGNRAVFQSGVGCCGDGSADFANLGKLAMPKNLVSSKGSVTFESLIIENRGTVELASGTLRLGRLGGYRQLSGSTRLVGGRLASDGTTLNIDGGTLAGTGTVSADVRTSSGGTVAPGAPGTAGSTGILRIAGNYGQHQGGVLETDIKGATPGRGFDQLQVTGTALLDKGTLDLDTARGYVPGTQTELKVLTAEQVSGAFGLVKDAGLPNGRQWRPLYNSRNVTLWVMTP